MKVLGLFIHSAKQDVLLKAELRILMLLAIAKGGTCVTIIEDDYSRSQGAHVPETFEGTTAVLENHIANKVISAASKMRTIRTDNSGVSESTFY